MANNLACGIPKTVENTYPHFQVAKVLPGLSLVDIHRVQVTQSKQNKLKLQVPLNLCEKYIKAGIEANQITILSGYQAQARLTKRLLALDSNIRVIKVVIFEASQGEEQPVIVS